MSIYKKVTIDCNIMLRNVTMLHFRAEFNCNIIPRLKLKLSKKFSINFKRNSVDSKNKHKMDECDNSII